MSVTVTATFGLVAAAEAIDQVVSQSIATNLANTGKSWL